MKVKRERLQIIQDILEAIQARCGEIKPTHIMYKANLSPQMLDEYLKYLTVNRFIIEKTTDKGKTYELTSKGIDYISQYKVIASFIQSFGLDED